MSQRAIWWSSFMSEKSLRERLVGAWALTSYVERDIETGVEDHPFGEHPLGFVLYTPDGYVSAQLQRPDRPPFADGDLLRATPKEYAAAGSSYIGYSGRFFIDEGKKTLSHEMAVSFFPNWLGQRQVRLVEVGNDRLQLSTDGPQRFNGTLKTATLTWQRARPNAAAAFTRFDPEFGIEILEPPGQSTDPAPSASNACSELGETHRELADNCMTP
jgi:hypothetical protein